MKNQLIAALLLGFFLCIPNAYALNITINDGVGAGNLNQSGEDNEVEPNNVKAQRWDLEGMFLAGNQLSIIGGYDFLTGEYGSGDIFIDVTGDAVFGTPAKGLDGLSGNGKKTIANPYGYDFVIDIDWPSLNYAVYHIDATTALTSVYYRQNDGSNAWRYKSGGTMVTGASGTAGYVTGLTDADTGFTGDWNGTAGAHNRLSLNLGWLADMGFADFTGHFTMGCGNDNLMGRGTLSVPEPASLWLIVPGLFGMIRLGRKGLLG